MKIDSRYSYSSGNIGTTTNYLPLPPEFSSLATQTVLTSKGFAEGFGGSGERLPVRKMTGTTLLSDNNAKLIGSELGISVVGRYPETSSDLQNYNFVWAFFNCRYTYSYNIAAQIKITLSQLYLAPKSQYNWSDDI